MLFLYVVLASFAGAYVGKFVSFITKVLPPFLLGEGEDRKAPRDLISDFFSNRPCVRCRYSEMGWRQLPIVSYLLAKGKCPSCLQPLSRRDFIIELFFFLGFALTALLFTLSPSILFIILAGTLLVCCFITDLEYGILPNQFTFPLVWIALVASLCPIFITSQGAILGAVAGYGILWVSNEVFRLFRGKDGIFPGDFKLCAAIGASVGLKYYLIILMLSMLLSIVGSAIQYFYNNRTIQSEYLTKEVSFGCYLAAVAIIFLYLLEPLPSIP